MDMWVLDHVIFSVLQLDSLQFDNLVELVNWDKDPARQWFGLEDIDDQQVLFTLKRMLAAGLITCHEEDATLGRPPIESPKPAHMKEYWYALTPAGEKIVDPQAPWYNHVGVWTFPSTDSKLALNVDDFRKNLHKWMYAPQPGVPASARGLRGWIGYSALLKSENDGNIAVHIFERLNVRRREFLQGHFRPVANSRGVSPEVSVPMEGVALTNTDLMVLDVLQDDTECVPLIVDILNHAASPYKKWHFGQAFSTEEVSAILARLVEGGYVVAYHEVEEPTLRLVPLGHPSVSETSALWFGLTDAGIKRASQPWPWED